MEWVRYERMKRFHVQRRRVGFRALAAEYFRNNREKLVKATKGGKKKTISLESAAKRVGDKASRLSGRSARPSELRQMKTLEWSLIETRRTLGEMIKRWEEGMPPKEGAMLGKVAEIAEATGDLDQMELNAEMVRFIHILSAKVIQLEARLAARKAGN